MKFKLYKEKNLTILIPVNKTFKVEKFLKLKNKIDYNYTKSEIYKKYCKNLKNLHKIYFIKKDKQTDILYVFDKQEIFVQGGKYDNFSRRNKS